MPLLPVILICDVACDVAGTLRMGPNDDDVGRRRTIYSSISAQIMGG